LTVGLVPFVQNAQYDRLFGEQQSAIEPARRAQIVDGMQRLMYQQTPMIFLAEPARVIAWNSSRWDGWFRSPPGVGAALGTHPIIDSYLLVRPRAASGPAQGSSRGKGLVVAVVIAGLVVVAWAVRRVRLRPTEEVES